MKTSVVRTTALWDEADDKGVSQVRVARIGANPGDTIRWEVDDRVVSIWFPRPGVFVSPIIALQHKGAVEMTIPESAKPGVYEYCIYCHDTDEFVVCESHPKVEIPKP